MKTLFLVLIGIFLLFGCTAATQKTATIDKDTSRETAEERALEQKEISESHPGEKQAVASEKIAGSATPYLRYNEADFNKARSEGKVIYMYFYATWCPICKQERPHVLSAFDKMSFNDVVGFEVHFNDGETTEEDREAARKYGISYQHTTLIFDKNRQLIYRSLSQISEEEIISEITKARGSI